MKAKILILDDDAVKVSAVRDLAKETGEEEWAELTIAGNAWEGYKLVSTETYDLLILDLNIPSNDKSGPDSEEAQRFLKELYSNTDLKPPRDLVILSAFEEIIQADKSFYESRGWRVLWYRPEVNDWKHEIISKLEYLKRCVQVEKDDIHKYDYCVITALRDPELLPVLKWDCNWEIANRIDSTEFHTGVIRVQNAEKKIVCGSAFRMGMVHSSLLVAKAWHYFRPKMIILIGIAAGVRGVVNLGDVLIAEEMWDYTAGKYSVDVKLKSCFLPDPRHVNAPQWLVEKLGNFGNKSATSRAIVDSWPANKPNTNLMVKRGPVASGSSVVSDKAVLCGVLKGNRKLIGLEMEGYGVYSACEYLPRPRPGFICVKSVCDFADEEKSDDWQYYAAYTSAEFVRLALEGGLFEEN